MRSSAESKKRDGRIQETSVNEGEDVVQRYDNGISEIRLHINYVALVERGGRGQTQGPASWPPDG
jgi:hypothetical protein